MWPNARHKSFSGAVGTFYEDPQNLARQLVGNDVPK